MKPEKQLYQWDVNQYLTGINPAAQYVDYPIGDEVIRLETDGTRCRIPDEILQTYGGKTCYERYSDGTFRAYSFSVLYAPKPPDYIYTPEERTTFEALTARVDAAIDEIKRRADSGEFTPVKGVDYFTDAEKDEMMESVSSGAVGEFREVVDTATTEYNVNHTEKMTAYDTNASEKLTTYDTNAEQHTTDYNRNAAEKLNAYNANADNRVAEFNSHTEQIHTDISELKSDLEAEKNARIEADTEHSARIQKVELKSSVNRYEIDNLKAKAEGKLYRTETVDAEAYTVDVPSSVAPYAEVQRIKGKNVMWNQHFDFVKVVTTGSQIQTNDVVDVYKDHVYLFIVDSSAEIGKSVKRKGIHWEYSFSIPNSYGSAISYVQGRNYFINTCKKTQTGIKPTIWYVIPDITLSNLMFIDLTQMFGSGNEPSLDECKKIFSADYYPYDTGTIKSFPVKTVRSVNAEGTEIGSVNVSSVTTDMKSAINVADEWENGKITRRVGSRSYISGDESDSSLITDGMTTYYPLDSPTEETVPEIDNYIKVEGGGTITFESDDAVHMPVPSTDRFIVDLS